MTGQIPLVGRGERSGRNLCLLAALAIVLTALYALIAHLSWQFEFDRPPRQRPILLVLSLFAAAFLAYLYAIRLAARAKQDRRLVGLIVAAAMVFRIVLLFSLPIQEVDIYRYLWDGAASTQGVSPFRYSPEQVRSAESGPTVPIELRKLVELQDRQPALAEILGRVHYGELPTIYPPTSQAVFAAATLTTPPRSSVVDRVIVMVLIRRIGWLRVAVPTGVFIVLTLLLVFPMAPGELHSPPRPNESPPAVSLAEPLPAAAPHETTPGDPLLGVTTFLRQWEMNDFLFLLVVENLKPTSQLPPERTAWFVVTPEAARRLVVSRAAAFGLNPAESPFLISRSLTAIVFIIVALVLAAKAARSGEVVDFLRAGFLTLAWFWLLCPTQNPWYWTWALPLLPFARSRAWLAVSGVVLMYYLRFWLGYHWPETPLLGTSYPGFQFFDFVVTWIEFGPVLAWLAVSHFFRKH